MFLAAGDRAGIERVMHYMTRCPFSLSRLVKVTESGQVVYKAEKDACRAFPDPAGRWHCVGAEAEFPGPRRRWISWPSSRSTFRPRARIWSATTAGTPTRHAACGGRRRRNLPSPAGRGAGGESPLARTRERAGTMYPWSR